MRDPITSALIKRGAREYFRDDDASLTWLNNAQHRAIINAVHDAYSSLDERGKKIVETLNKDDAPGMHEAVLKLAPQLGLSTTEAWRVLHRFADKIAERLKL